MHGLRYRHAAVYLVPKDSLSNEISVEIVITLEDLKGFKISDQL